MSVIPARRVFTFLSLTLVVMAVFWLGMPDALAQYQEQRTSNAGNRALGKIIGFAVMAGFAGLSALAKAGGGSQQSTDHEWR
ncbi:MAG: hypothetical protein KC656_11850 [Myxococcales bacterium]|nr:hypothetical protein [Myxococcales bacterium]